MPRTHSLLRSVTQLLEYFRVWKAILSKTTALLLLAALLVPVWLAKPIMTVKAASPKPPSESPQPGSEPSPFIVAAAQEQTALSTVIAAHVATDIGRVFEPEYVAPGLALPNSSAWDRALATISSVLGFLVPTKATKAPSTETTMLAVATTPSIKYDFDGDGKADTGRWHSAGTEFKVRKADGSGNLTYSLGSSGAVAAPGDFNGDGNTDAGVFSGGTWTYKTSTGATAQTISLGSSGDTPMAADFDGDGKTDACVTYVTSGQRYFKWKQSSNGTVVTNAWGGPNDIPITGDWDGDGKADYAIYRPSSGEWWTAQSTNGVNVYTWGNSTDIPVEGDFDGNGKSDLALYRPSTGAWWIKNGLGFSTVTSTTWGTWYDQPVPADYDGDGKTDIAVWRPSDDNYYIINSGGSPSTSAWTLGVEGDEAVTSAYIKQVGGTATPDDISEARLRPANATGDTNYYSQNFHWGTNLVSLPAGHAGLNLNLGLSYNSLMWTKVGTTMYYDRDEAASQMTPGFRLAFPVIEPAYYNAATSKWSYLLIGSDGSRTDFREISASNVYETADSSHAQITANGASNPYDPVEGLTLTLVTTDGSQYSYTWIQEAYKCTQIEDHNGNYISIHYDGSGKLDYMTDTLGRVVTVNYNTDLWPSTITQTWKDTNGAVSNTTHTWATFSYTTKSISTSFYSSITAVVAPPNGESMTVLDKVTYADGSSTKFDYNDYLQVKKVSNIAANSTSHVLNYTQPNLASPSSPPPIARDLHLPTIGRRTSMWLAALQQR